MDKKVFLYAAWVWIMAICAAACNKTNEPPAIEEEFCLCDSSLTIPAVNEFLASLPNDDSEYITWFDYWGDDSNFERRKLLKLEEWLQSHSCVSYAQVGCHACMEGDPRLSRVIVMADENGTTKDYMLEIAMSNLKVAKAYPRLGCDCKDELFYFYDNKKVFRDEYIDYRRFRNDCLIVWFFDEVQDTEMTDYINQTGLFRSVTSKNILYHARKEFEGDYHLMYVETKEQKTCSQLKEIIRILEKSRIVALADLTLEGERRSPPWSEPFVRDILIFPNYFDVKVNDENDLSDLYTLLQETDTWIAFWHEDWPQWFNLGSNKNSKDNARQVTDYFHKTGKFENVEVGYHFIITDKND